MSRLDMTPGAVRAVLALFVVTLLLFGANLVFTAREVNRATATAASVAQLCQLGNKKSAEQVTFWEHVVAAFTPPRETPAQARQRLAADRVFLAYVRGFFAPVNCQAPLQPRRQP